MYNFTTTTDGPSGLCFSGETVTINDLLRLVSSQEFADLTDRMEVLVEFKGMIYDFNGPEDAVMFVRGIHAGLDADVVEEPIDRTEATKPVDVVAPEPQIGELSELEQSKVPDWKRLFQDTFVEGEYNHPK